MSGGRGVPQFPGKLEGQNEFPWTGQMCPPLTSAEVGAVAAANYTSELAAVDAKLLTAGGAVARATPQLKKVDARRCQGPLCAWFVPIGTKGDGACAEKMKVITAHNQNLLLEAIALKLGAITKDPAADATQAAATS